MSQINIACDAAPLLLFTELLKRALQGRQGLLNFSDPGFELARVESDFCSAAAGELTVRLYPSDAFLRFAVTLFAGDFDFGAIKLKEL